jgi:hypothetical protein
MVDAATVAKLAPFLTAVLGGAVGAVLTQAATFLRDWLTKTEEGQFTALTLALQLESYASTCAEPVYAIENYVEGHTSEPSGSLPALPEFSDKTNWKGLGTQHASAVLGFRVEVNVLQGGVAQVWEIEGPVAAWGAAADSAVEAGADALRIAGDLRRAFRLGPMPKHGVFDPEEFFAVRLADLKKRRAEAMRIRGEVWEEFFGKLPDGQTPSEVQTDRGDDHTKPE